jgi:D-amino-acid dehydrogenase
MSKRIAIVGGGIIGLCSAYYLQKSGHEVHVYDTHDFDDSCSYGNAGMIVPSHMIPLAAPGMISKGLKWMFKASSPFYVHPQMHYSFLRWLYLFYHSSNQIQVNQSIPILTEMSLQSKSLWKDLALDLDLNLKQKGILMLYKSVAAAEEETRNAKIATDLGLENKVLSKDEVNALENVSVDVLGAVHYTCDAHLSPRSAMMALKNHLNRSGVQLHSNSKVDRLEVLSKNRVEVCSNYTPDYFEEVVIASGSWSHQLAKMLDFKLPLLPGKGYSITIPKVQNHSTIPSILCEAKVAISPFENDFRVSGTMELGGLNSTINSKRIDGIINSINQYYPNFDIKPFEVKNAWTGLRPCSPDGMPYIGTHPKFSNVKIATGHGMMGLSLAPVTGLYISEIINSERKSIPNLEPNRFS